MEFFKMLPENFIHLKNNALKILSMFGSQYICEQFFSGLNLRKNQHSSRITKDKLASSLRVACSNSIQPDYDVLLNIN